MGRTLNAMTFYAPHAFIAVDAVRRATRGYGPPSRDPQSRRTTRPRRQPRERI
jgi:hypothetical protein